MPIKVNILFCYLEAVDKRGQLNISGVCRTRLIEAKDSDFEAESLYFRGE